MFVILGFSLKKLEPGEITLAKSQSQKTAKYAKFADAGCELHDFEVDNNKLVKNRQIKSTFYTNLFRADSAQWNIFKKITQSRLSNKAFIARKMFLCEEEISEKKNKRGPDASRFICSLPGYAL